MYTVTQDEAVHRLPELIDEATRKGEEVIVLRGSDAVAKIIPFSAPSPSPSPRKAGSAKAKGLYFYIAEDFDAPLDDLAEYM